MNLRQILDVFLIASLGFVLGSALVRRVRRPGWLTPWVAVVAISTVGVALLRLALVRPGFLHSNFHGYGLLGAIANFPAPPTHRAEYGNVSFLVLGAIWKLGGERWEAVTTANQLFAALALGLMAHVAASWVGRPRVALFVLAAGALHPALARVAASEDAHVLAVLFGCIALLALDVYRTSRARSMLLAGTLATLLMIESRQTMYAWAPCLLIIAGARSDGALRKPEFRAAAALVLAATIARILETSLLASDRVTLVMLPILISAPGALWALLSHHPLFDVTRMAALTLPLFAVGVASLVKHSRAGKGMALLLVSMFVLTLPMGFPTPGVELSFRLPLMLPAVALVGIGSDVLLVKVAESLPRAQNAAVVGAVVAALALAPLALSGRQLLRQVSMETVEYDFLRSAARTLPTELTIATLDLQEPGPAYSFPRTALAEAGLAARFVRLSELSPADFDAGPVFFYVGLGCYAYSLGELIGAGNPRQSIPIELIRDNVTAIFRRQVGHIAKTTVRPECAPVLAHSKIAKAPTLTLRNLTLDVPFVVYGAAPVTLRFVEMASPAE